MKEDLNERILLERCSVGNREAFALLYTRHLQPLYRHVFLFLKCRESSEEIVQDVFVKLWENREKLVEINSFRAYILRVSRNMILDHIRRLNTRQRVIHNITPSSETDESTSEDLLVYKDYLNIAQEAIDQLTDKRKEIFLMRTQQELSIDQIAADLHISRSVVKKQLYTSLNLVRDHIQRRTDLSSGILLFVALFFREI